MQQQQHHLPDLDTATTTAQREREKRANELAAALETEVPMPIGVDNDEESATAVMLPASTNAGVTCTGGSGESQPTGNTEAILVDEGEEESLHPATQYVGDDGDQEEKEAEARVAGNFPLSTSTPNAQLSF